MKKIIIAIFLVLITETIHAQAFLNTSFHKWNTEKNSARITLLTNSKNCVVEVKSELNPITKLIEEKLIICQCAIDGTIEWSKQLNIGSNPRVTSLITDNQGFVGLTGYYKKNNINTAFVIQYDMALMQIRFQKEFGEGNTIPNCLIQSKINNNYIIVGDCRFKHNNTYQPAYFIASFNLTNNTSWIKSINTIQHDLTNVKYSFTTVCEIKDGYAISGYRTISNSYYGISLFCNRNGNFATNTFGNVAINTFQIESGSNWGIQGASGLVSLSDGDINSNNARLFYITEGTWAGSNVNTNEAIIEVSMQYNINLNRPFITDLNFAKVSKSHNIQLSSIISDNDNIILGGSYNNNNKSILFVKFNKLTNSFENFFRFNNHDVDDELFLGGNPNALRIAFTSDNFGNQKSLLCGEVFFPTFPEGPCKFDEILFSTEKYDLKSENNSFANILNFEPSNSNFSQSDINIESVNNCQVCGTPEVETLILNICNTGDPNPAIGFDPCKMFGNSDYILESLPNNNSYNYDSRYGYYDKDWYNGPNLPNGKVIKGCIWHSLIPGNYKIQLLNNSGCTKKEINIEVRLNQIQNFICENEVDIPCETPLNEYHPENYLPTNCPCNGVGPINWLIYSELASGKTVFEAVLDNAQNDDDLCKRCTMRIKYNKIDPQNVQTINIGAYPCVEFNLMTAFGLCLDPINPFALVSHYKMDASGNKVLLTTMPLISGNVQLCCDQPQNVQGSHIFEVMKANGCICRVIVNLICETPAPGSIEEQLTINTLKNNQNLLIVPNPTSSIFRIINSTNKNIIYDLVEVMDYTGKVISSYSNINSDNEYNLSEYSKGIYLIRVKTGSNYQQLKLILQ